jgi:hypothetical protein
LLTPTSTAREKSFSGYKGFPYKPYDKPTARPMIIPATIKNIAKAMQKHRTFQQLFCFGNGVYGPEGF